MATTEIFQSAAEKLLEFGSIQIIIPKTGQVLLSEEFRNTHIAGFQGYTVKITRYKGVIQSCNLGLQRFSTSFNIAGLEKIATGLTKGIINLRYTSKTEILGDIPADLSYAGNLYFVGTQEGIPFQVATNVLDYDFKPVFFAGGGGGYLIDYKEMNSEIKQQMGCEYVDGKSTMISYTIMFFPICGTLVTSGFISLSLNINGTTGIGYLTTVEFANPYENQ